MKKSRNLRRREGRLTVKQIQNFSYFANMGREYKAGYVSLVLKRDGIRIQTVSILEDVKERQSIVILQGNRIFALPYKASVAKPYKMTLAKWKSIDGKMICANR